MGNAVDWQGRLCEDLQFFNAIVLNPRRSDRDSSWIQSIDNARFAEQVNWELDALQAADIIIFYFDPATKSPITLMELGLFAHTGKVIVCFPEGYWRKGNVDIVCKRYNIPLTDNYESMYHRLTLLL